MREILWIYTKLVALLLLPLALIIAYANSDIEIATPVFALEKVSMPKSIPSLPDSPAPADTIAAVDTIEVGTIAHACLIGVDRMFIAAPQRFRGYGLPVTGYGLGVMGYGLWVMGYGLPVMGYRLRVYNYQLSLFTFQFSIFNFLSPFN